MNDRAWLAGLLVAAAMTVWSSSWPAERAIAVVGRSPARHRRAGTEDRVGTDDVVARWAAAPRCWLLTGVAAAAGTFAGGLVAGGLLAVMTAAAARVLRRRRQVALEAARRGATVDVAMALAAELRAGQPLPAALAAAAEVGGPVQACLREAAGAAALGGDPAPMLRTAGVLPGASGLTAVAAAWDVASNAGASLSHALVAVARALDEEERTRHEVQAQLAGPRATGRALLGLPLLGVAMAASIGAHPGQLLLHTGWGALLCAVATGLAVAGSWWLELLARRAAPP